MTDRNDIFVEDATQSAKFTGFVMREDTIVAKIKEDVVTDFTLQAPLYLQRTKNFSQWLEDRGADTNRSYMRTILGHLRLPLLNIEKAVKAVHAASLTDSFWIKTEAENMQYADIMFKNDIYYKAALQGDPDLFELPKVKTPEITNIGSYNKGWHIKNGRWVLYKAGKALEIFSELFTSKLALALGLDAVRYYIDGGFIVCENFVSKGWCFEHAKSLIGENLDYDINVKAMNKVGALKKYMDLIFMDALVRNGDRHEFNYGVLTSMRGFIKMAPNFDNNMALFWNGVPNTLLRKDGMVSEFIDVYKEIDYTLPVVTDILIRKTFRETVKEYPIDVREDTVVQFCMNAYTQMRESKPDKKSDVITDRRNQSDINKSAKLNERQRSVLAKVHQNGITRKQYAEIFSVSASTAAEDLDELVRLGYFKWEKEKSGMYRYYKA